MSMTKQEVAALLEKFANGHKIPLTFKEDDEGTYVSEKKFDFELTETPGYAKQMIKVCNDQAMSFCIVEDDNDLDRDILDRICSILQPKYPCVFNYDAEEYMTLWTCMPVSFSYFEDMPEDKEELFMLHFFRRSIKCCRIFYHAYKYVKITEMTVEDAVKTAEAEAEENGYEYYYIYNTIRDIVEACGTRYFVEHKYLPDNFYSCPDFYFPSFKDGNPSTVASLFTFPIELYDLPYVSEYDKVTDEVLIDTDKVKCIHFSIPHCLNEFDCSDIMLVVSDKGNKYFTVELGGILPHKAKPVFYLCSWEEGCHSNYGAYKNRDEAMKEFMQILEKYK